MGSKMQNGGLVRNLVGKPKSFPFASNDPLGAGETKPRTLEMQQKRVTSPLSIRFGPFSWMGSNVHHFFMGGRISATTLRVRGGKGGGVEDS